MDFSFEDNEDFGFAKSFSNAPACMITPDFRHQEFTNDDKPDNLCMDLNPIGQEGFNFKLAPVENVGVNSKSNTQCLTKLCVSIASSIPERPEIYGT